jgi:hypothetical protein
MIEAYSIKQIVDRDKTTLWIQSWKIVDQLGLDKEHEVSWNKFIRGLQMGRIQLNDRDDDLVWKHNPNGLYTTKFG